jgi:hypothetical protein
VAGVSYRFVYLGTEVRCESAAEVVAFLALASGQKPPPQYSKMVLASCWPTRFSSDWVYNTMGDAAMSDKIAGYLEVGRNERGEIVINHPALETDAQGVGHIVFSVNQARILAELLWKHAAEAEGSGLGPG